MKLKPLVVFALPFHVTRPSLVSVNLPHHYIYTLLCCHWRVESYLCCHLYNFTSDPFRWAVYKPCKLLVQGFVLSVKSRKFNFKIVSTNSSNDAIVMLRCVCALLLLPFVVFSQLCTCTCTCVSFLFVLTVSPFSHVCLLKLFIFVFVSGIHFTEFCC